MVNNSLIVDTARTRIFSYISIECYELVWITDYDYSNYSRLVSRPLLVCKLWHVLRAVSVFVASDDDSGGLPASAGH